ncbi:serine/threonine-protein kinase [Actinomadura sp. 9N215]|uniref:serine/threonine-protein kinase n=1 Tax=Actinomadura sp. 9N215 TaxID=3375150 RepID=UPI00378A75F6
MASRIPLTAADPTRLGGWELLGRIGTGGQGVVYLGRPAGPGPAPRGGTAPHGPRNASHRVAVKLLHARLLGNADARERFVRELALLQRVAGFCTAQMLDADTAGDRPYIVSEYVPGPSLRSLVQERGPRTGADLDRLAISSVTALSAIHRANVVHRDLKPQNVLMGPDGPRVIDFGIARAFDTNATMTSQVVGTPAYMAPEQFTGRVVPATDLFAWAGTLLFAATGRDPFAGGPLPAVMYRIMNETPDLSALPGPLADVAAACLAKDPKARPSSEDVLLWLLGERERHARLGTAHERLPGPAAAQPAPSPPSAPGGETFRDADPATIRQPPPDRTPPGTAPFVHDSEPRRSEWPQAVPPAPPQPSLPSQPPAPHRTLRRSPALSAGLVLAGLLAALDVAALAVLIAMPSLTEGDRGALLPVVAASFAVVAVVTLVAVILAWRGSRPAAWTVMAARVARIAMWGAWGALVQIQASALAGHAVLTAIVVILLARGLSRSPR